MAQEVLENQITSTDEVSASIYTYSDLVSERLMHWARLNTVVGLMLAVNPSQFAKGFASQMISWGVIDGTIAHFGNQSSQKRRQEPDGYDEAVLAEQTKNLRLALWINAGLDVIYVITGLVVANRSDRKMSKGIGWGIVVQGLFLFLFDLFHALKLDENIQE